MTKVMPPLQTGDIVLNCRQAADGTPGAQTRPNLWTASARFPTRPVALVGAGRPGGRAGSGVKTAALQRQKRAC
jgi:hypothetical protein